MAAAKHAHKYRRHRYKTGKIVYFCALPDCNIKVDPALVLGKKAVCWRCGQEFIMNEYSIRLASPHCDNCHKPKNQEVLPDLPDVPVTVSIPIETPIQAETMSLRDRLRQATQPDEDI